MKYVNCDSMFCEVIKINWPPLNQSSSEFGNCCAAAVVAAAVAAAGAASVSALDPFSTVQQLCKPSK